MLLRRRTRPKLGIRQRPQIRCPAHLAWIRATFECVACVKSGAERTSGIEAAHVRTGTDGGMGVKPSDFWAIPLCAVHHAAQHREGEKSFEARYGIDMKKIAMELAAKSPHRAKWSDNRTEEGDG